MVGLESMDGKKIKGHEIESCKALEGDSLSKTVTWKKGSDISYLDGKNLRLRIELKNAELYSFQFQPWLR